LEELPAQPPLTATDGTAPYTYSWNTTPVQTTAIATGLAAGTYTVTITDAGWLHDDGYGYDHPTSSIFNRFYQPPRRNVTASEERPGSATVTATGGTAPYTYSWNTRLFKQLLLPRVLPPGTYTVTIPMRVACTTTATATITEPAAALAASITATTNVTALRWNDWFGYRGPQTGGTAPHTYSWQYFAGPDRGFCLRSCCRHLYGYYHRCGGCTTTATATITEPAAASQRASRLLRV